jgi:transposase, IS5 family
MLRSYFLQQWYGLADEAVEDALYDSQALRGFAGIDLNQRRQCCNSAIGWSGMS